MLLVVIQTDQLSLPAPRRSWRRLGCAAQLERLLKRSKPRAGQVEAFSLDNASQTQVIVGLVDPVATPFQRLALSGRMTKAAPALRLAGRTAAVAFAPASSADQLLEPVAAAVLAAAFELPRYRGPAHPKTRRRRPELTVWGATSLDLPRLRATSAAANLARWLTALPPNLLDAAAYRRTLAAVARKAGLGFRWIGEPALRRAGAGAFLAVASGNANRDAGIAHLTWRPKGAKRSAPELALVGKGILFDTGGTNLKSHRSMLEMHTDMAGSAVALASLLALAELRAPIAADAWLAITENRIGATAYRPQDVVHAANGVTVQVIHTDAEGRMALADTLALAGRTRPRLMIDYATLTGSCVVALTERISGAFTNRVAVLQPLLESAGQASGERLLCFPMDDDFDTDLESKTADIAQCAVDGKGDHILAARFLSRFVPEDTAWAHVDLTSATRAGGLGHVNTDITGFGVRWTLSLLLDHDALGEMQRSAAKGKPPARPARRIKQRPVAA